MARRVESGREGFALPAVLAVTALVTMVFLVAVTSLDSLGREARRARDAAAFQADSATVEARVLFLLATEPIAANRVRVGETRAYDQFEVADPDVRPVRATASLFIDGRTYRLKESADFDLRVQDQAGLINLNFLGRDAQIRLFERLGLDGPAAARAADRLADYIDGDDLRRPSGAEADEYRAAGAPAPKNFYLQSPAELFGVLGLRAETDPDRRRAIAPYLAADPGSNAFNLNAAPAEALGVVYGLSDDQARAATARRKIQPYFGMAELSAETGLPLYGGPEQIVALGSGRLIVRLSDRRRERTKAFRVVLTPNDRDRPFWLDLQTVEPLGRVADAEVSEDATLSLAPR